MSGVGPLIAAVIATGAADLEALRWTARVLVVFAERATDPRLAEQAAVIDAARDGAAERDLTVLPVIGTGPEARALRQRLGVPPDAAFRVVLVGKDGGAKRSADQPITAGDLFGTIDQMPMRRREAGLD